MKSTASLIRASGTRFVLLTPCAAEVPKAFQNVIADECLHEELLGEMQRFRGIVYLSDGAILRHEMTDDGRHALPIDRSSWHVLALNEHGHVSACLRYQDETNATGFDDLWARHAALYRCSRWGDTFRQAVETEVSLARQRRLSFGEVCGWAVAPDRRWTPDPLRIVLAMYGVLQILGGSTGVATATYRHNSALILSRIGLSALSVDGIELPSYYDPQYRCEMRVLRYDSRCPNTRYLPWVAEFSSYWRTAPVVSPREREPASASVIPRALRLPGAQADVTDSLIHLSQVLMLVAASVGAKMAAPGGATVPLADGGEGARGRGLRRTRKM